MAQYSIIIHSVATITVATALYKCVESEHWSGNCDQEVQNFVQTLEKAKQLVPNGDSLRLEKLQSFKKTAIEDMALFLELKL